MKGENSKPFRILSLDGGGIRGAFIAAFLADLERRLKCRLHEYFDLIAGTSTGGIIAGALALGEPAERIETFYRERGPKIFTRRPPVDIGWMESWKAGAIEKQIGGHGLDYDHLKQSKYTADELKNALAEVFGDKTIEAAQTRMIIPAVDMTRGQTIVFKTPHLPGMVRDRHYKVVDVLLATSAAPSYFPHAVIGPGSAYVDGGLWVNNPSMAAVAEALKIRETANRDGVDVPIELESILLLSVGTGRATYFAKPPDDGAGLFFWGPILYNVSSVAQSQGINFQTQYILGDRAFRIDYDLPDGTWSLDSVDMLEQMMAIGRERCTENINVLQQMFFNGKAQHPYHAFADVAPAGS